MRESETVASYTIIWHRMVTFLFIDFIPIRNIFKIKRYVIVNKESPLEQQRVSHRLPLLTHLIFAVAVLQDMKCYLIVNF